MLRKAPSAFSMLEGFANLGEACLRLSAAEWAAGSATRQRRVRSLTKDVLQAMRRFAQIFPIGRPRYHWLAGWHAWQRGRPRRACRHWTRGLRAARVLGMGYELARLYYDLHVHLGETPSDHTPPEVRAFWPLLQSLNAIGRRGTQ